MGQVWQGSLDEEQGAEDVDGVDFREDFSGGLLDCVEAGDAGVVDQDVDLEFSRLGVREVVFRCRD